MLRVAFFKVVGVQPVQLVGIEGRRRAVDRFELEQRDHLVDREHFLITMRPAQAHQVIQQRLGQVAVFFVLHHADRAVALGQARAVITEDHRQVRKLRHIPAHRLVQVDLTRGVVDVVIAADHLGDAHVVIVHHHGQVVGRRAVGAADDQIVQLVVGYADLALHQILEQHRAFRRVAETDHVRLIG